MERGFYDLSQNKLFRARRSNSSYSGAGVLFWNGDTCNAHGCAEDPDD
jgi:hypothetical protein